MSAFDDCLAITRGYEGGNDDDPRDPGGRTSRGITQREYDVYRQDHPGLPADVWAAPDSALDDIYRVSYWDPQYGDRWPRGLDLAVFDGGVNSGIGASLRWCRVMCVQSQGAFVTLAGMASAFSDKTILIKRYCAARLSFLEALVTWRTFGRGWSARVAGIEKTGVSWALASAGSTPTEIAAHHAAEAAKAQKAMRKHTARAGGTAAAGGAAATVHSWDWTHILGVAIFAAIFLGFLAFFAWNIYTQNARAKAYAK